MNKLPKEYVIVEIVPTNSNSKVGFIAQIQALKIKNNKIVQRLDLRVKEELIENDDLLRLISYDKDMFEYMENREDLVNKFIDFIGNKKLLIIDNDYTRSYLKNIPNEKESVFNYLGLEVGNNVFDQLIEKYQLVPSNHLVDLLFEALMLK